MVTKLNKLTRATLFRDRLRQAMARGGVSQSALARQTGVDRSTISQAVSDEGARLPNGHLVGAVAAALGVSADWLLGLSDSPESARTLLANAMRLADAPRALVDEQVFAWHQEAEGYKIRYVPAALPDMLKTRGVLQWEYAPHLGRSTEQAIAASEERLDWMRRALSDYEIALPLHELHSLARGEGYYADLPPAARREQLAHLTGLSQALYPRLRLYLFDARQVYSAPMTIFGPLLVALYIGRNYMIFRDSERVRGFTEHFDALVRAAEFGARETTEYLARLPG